jgi:hypothetical protein
MSTYDDVFSYRNANLSLWQAGTENEVKVNFLDICRSVLGNIPIHTLRQPRYVLRKGVRYLLGSTGWKRPGDAETDF